MAETVPTPRLLVFPIVSSCTFGDPIPYPIVGTPTSISFSPDGNCLAVGNAGSGGGVSIFSIDDACVPTFVPPQLLPNQLTRSVLFSPFSSCLVVFNETNGTLNIFNRGPNCNFEQILPTIPINIDTNGLPDMAFTPNGHCFAIAVRDPGVNPATLYIFSTNIVAPPVIAQAIPQCNGIVTVTGTATPGLTVQVLVDEIPVGESIIVDADGTFEVTVGSIELGVHTITAVATNTDTGCSSESSNAVVVTIISGPTITNLQVTCLNTVIVSGTAVPGIPVSILVDDNPMPVGMGLPNNQGIFIVATQPVPTGTHCFTVVQEECPSAVPTCVNVAGQSCVLGAPNLAFGTHCNV